MRLKGLLSAPGAWTKVCPKVPGVGLWLGAQGTGRGAQWAGRLSLCSLPEPPVTALGLAPCSSSPNEPPAAGRRLGGQWLDYRRVQAEDPCIWGQLWPLLGANNGLDTKQPAWIFSLPPFCAERGQESERLGRGDRHPTTWSNLAPPPYSLWSLCNFCLPTELGDAFYYQGDPK